MIKIVRAVILVLLCLNLLNLVLFSAAALIEGGFAGVLAGAVHLLTLGLLVTAFRRAATVMAMLGQASR